MLHHIKSYAGTPNKSEYLKPIEVSMKYSYGNYLMGFANRSLNLELSRNRQSLDWGSGKIKRPYEILRDNYITDVPKEVDGIDIIRLTRYSETVYPKEIYTYLSESRGRLAFKNNFWRNDKKVSSQGFSTSVTSLATIADEGNIELYNRQIPRISSSFVTSQGYLLQRSEQVSYDTVSSTAPAGQGSGSIWSMDSFLYSDYTSSLESIVDGGGIKVGLAAASTLAAGELMLTSYGQVKQNSSANSSRYERAGTVSAQYIYSAPAMDETCTAISAVAATAAITSVVAPAAAVAATIVISIPSTYTDVCLDKGVMTLNDGSSGACTITFDVGTDQTPSACGGTLGYDESGTVTVSTIATKIANGINAIYGTNFTAVANSPSAGSVTVTASPAGTAGNSYTVQWVPDAACGSANDSIQLNGSNAPATAVNFTGGTAAVSIEDETITIQYDDGSGGSGTHTMTFKEDGTASSTTIIDVSSATTVGAVATAIGTTITAASSGIAINVSSVAGAVVNLVAATAGTHQNGKQIAGSAEAAGTISAVDFSGGVDAGVACIYDVKPRSPGGTPSRPAWIAPSQRRTIEGPRRGELLPARTPFYDSYDEYANDVRAKGQEYTIIPEYRMSEHVPTYQNNNSSLSLVAATLDITGANSTVFNTSVTPFFDRYLNSDNLQYLDQFMNTENLDFSFNSFPKQLKVESDSVVKLLPYDGFYPMDRSLQIAKLFSSSYGHVFSGVSGSSHHAMRANLRPYFAPGIFYNSIKSGMAVDYPVRRVGRNEDQFLPLSAEFILGGCLSGALASPTAGEIPGIQQNIDDRRRFTGNNPATVGQGEIDFSLNNTNKMFWGDRLPFESILAPELYLSDSQVVLSDINEIMFNDVSGSIKGTLSNLYKKSISNFMASTPEFFLKKKANLHGSDGYLTKFVGRLPTGGGADPSSPSDSSTLRLQFGGRSSPGSSVRTPATVFASADAVYIMEVGVTKTDKVNLYNNPYAFGVPTATGSAGWAAYDSGSLGNKGAQRPSGSSWPKHRGEFAPFTPPYFYGTSTARIMFAPPESRQYQLSEIIGESAQHTYIEFVNESGSFYDFDIGSYIGADGNVKTTSGTPLYGWNRAWQNRMDVDASLSLTNVFALDAGSTTPHDPDKWVIMPKWECPILDFPNYGTTRSDGNQYSFSSSVDIGSFDVSEGTFGMWHQYGVTPQQNEGVFMFIKDVDLKETELRLVGDPSLGASNATGQQVEVRKVPKWVMESGKSVASLADLTGFDPNEVMRGGFDLQKAKRLGVLGETNEKQISEAVLAMPYFVDKNGKPKFMTMSAKPEELGVKIKEFRRKFTKYNLPPALAARLSILIPSSYPNIPNFINPFGGDDLDSTLQGVDFGFLQTPVVYLMEHNVRLSRQDLADMWQGMLPDVGKSLRVDLTAIDHYMPADQNEQIDNDHRIMPEILEKELDLGLPRNGIPRVDLLDISKDPNFSSNGFNVDIRWFVFKVKRRGLKSYSKLITNEINGYSFSPYRAAVLDSGGTQEALDVAALLQYADDHAINDPTFNWPQDYFSLVELNKLTITTGFRPDILKENQELEPIPDQAPVLDPAICPQEDRNFRKE